MKQSQFLREVRLDIGKAVQRQTDTVAHAASFPLHSTSFRERPELIQHSANIISFSTCIRAVGKDMNPSIPSPPLPIGK